MPRSSSGWGRSGHRRAVVVGAVVTAVIVGGGIATWAEVSGGSTGYRLATVTRADIGTSMAVVGDVEPVSDAAASFQVEGKVATVTVTPGQHVTSGQTLGTLDTTALSEAVSSAQSTLNADEAKLVEDEENQAAAASTPSNGSSSPNAARTPSSSASSSTTTTAPAHNGTGPGGSGGAGASNATVTQDQTTLTQDETVLSNDQQKEAADLAQAQSECKSTNTSAPAGQATCEAGLQTVSADEQQVSKDQTTVSKDETALGQALAAESSGGANAGAGGATGASGAAGNTGAGAAQSARTSHSSDAIELAAFTGNTGSGAAGTGSASNAGSGSGGTGGGSTNTDTPEQIASDQAAIDTAEADLTNAQQSLHAATLTSPITGTVVSVGISVGTTVSADSSTEIITIIGTAAYEVQATLDSAQIPDVKVGQTATVAVDGQDDPLKGTVSQVGPVQSGNSGYTYPVVVSLPSSASGLFSGSTASVRISTGAVSNVVAVPTSAVQSLGSRTYVLELAKDTLTRKVITVGMVGDEYTQVLSGLSPGQSVVLADYAEQVPSSNTNTNLGGLGGLGGGNGFFGDGGFPGAFRVQRIGGGNAIGG